MRGRTHARASGSGNASGSGDGNGGASRGGNASGSGDRSGGASRDEGGCGIGIGDEGSGTLLVVALLALVLVMGGLVLSVGTVRVARVHLQAVADLAALAGADASAPAGWVDVGDVPCGRAGEVAAANGVEVLTCEVIASDTRVRVGREVHVGGMRLDVEARARAGPRDG